MRIWHVCVVTQRYSFFMYWCQCWPSLTLFTSCYQRKSLFFLAVIGLSSSNMPHQDEWLHLWRHVAITCLIRTNKSTRLDKGHRRSKPLLERAYQVNLPDWLYSCGSFWLTVLSTVPSTSGGASEASAYVCISVQSVCVSLSETMCLYLFCLSICLWVWNRRWGCNNVALVTMVYQGFT